MFIKTYESISIILSGINLFITLCLNIVWILVCMRECYRDVNRYLTCKRTPDLHPVYKDVQYLSRQRKLYNLETHIVKYFLVISCTSVEVVAIVCVAMCSISSVVIKIPPNEMILAEKMKYLKEYPNCNFDHRFWKLLLTPQLMWFQNLMYFIGFLGFVLISILTRYLAARYLNHSFNKTLYRYIVWISVQFCVVAFCSNKFTFIFSIFAFPLHCIINWLVLLRDNRILGRILRSNLTELELHSNNRVLYHEQVTGYRCYRFFSKVLLISVLLLVITVITENLTQLLRYSVETSFCLLKIIYDLNFAFELHFNNTTLTRTTEIMNTMTNTCILIYSISSSLPIICITLFPLIRACVRRYKSRYMVYRYNYENIQPLIRR